MKIIVQHKYTKGIATAEIHIDFASIKTAGELFEQTVKEMMYKLGCTDKEYINIKVIK